MEVKQTHLADTPQARSAMTAKAVPALLIICLPSRFSEGVNQRPDAR